MPEFGMKLLQPVSFYLPTISLLSPYYLPTISLRSLNATPTTMQTEDTEAFTDDL